MGGKQSIIPKDIYLTIFKLAIKEDNSIAINVWKTCHHSFNDMYICNMARRELKKRYELFIHKVQYFYSYDFKYSFDYLRFRKDDFTTSHFVKPFYRGNNKEYIDKYGDNFVLISACYSAYGCSRQAWYIYKAKWKFRTIYLFIGNEVRQLRREVDN